MRSIGINEANFSVAKGDHFGGRSGNIDTRGGGEG